MNKISFSLKEPTADKDTAIILRFYAADGRLKYYTGQSIHPSKWKPSTQVAADKGVTAVLKRIARTVEALDEECKVKGISMSKALVSARLDTVLLVVRAGISDVVFPAFDWVAAQMYAGKILTKAKKRYSPGTVRTIENATEILKRFNPALRFDEVTAETCLKYIVYCNEQNYTLNYTGTLVKNWKTLMRATQGRYHENRAYEDFERMSEDVFDVYLDEDEKTKLYKADLSFYPRWETSRDWFILGCYLGLRVNDLVALEDDKHLQKGFITVVNEKTDTKVVIPVHRVAAAILKRYKGFPPAITNEELNRTIKDVAQHLKMNDRVVYSVTKGGRRQDFPMEKWQMISTHTMRRSFVTNLLKIGVPDSIVMKLAGIKSYATLKKYNKLTAEEAGRIAAGLDYFKG